MSFAMLLHVPENPRGQAAFAFDHDMIHRFYLNKMPSASRTWQFDPAYATNEFSSSWHLNHQQAHNDFNFAARIPSPNSILKETNLNDARNLTWWTFINHAEHYRANMVLAP